MGPQPASRDKARAAVRNTERVRFIKIFLSVEVFVGADDSAARFFAVCTVVGYGAPGSSRPTGFKPIVSIYSTISRPVGSATVMVLPRRVMRPLSSRAEKAR